MRILEPYLTTIRTLVDETNRHRLTLEALEDKLNKELLDATGVDVNEGEWTLDVGEGVLICNEEKETTDGTE